MYKYTHIHTHAHTQKRVLRLLPPSFARVQLTILRFYNLAIGVLGNVTHTISRFLLSHHSSFIEATAPGYLILIELLLISSCNKIQCVPFFF